MIGRRTALGGLVATSLTVSFGLDAAARSMRADRRSTGRPNVLVILADDLGFADLGCYGGDIETPHLDRLAGAGARYTNFRTAAVCAATRASLLTGLNPHSAGVGLLTDEDRGYPGYRGDLTRANSTTAETLRASGYATFHVGKWHLNHVSSSSAAGPRDNWPLQRGFEKAYWFQGHSSDYLRPADLFDGNAFVEAPEQPDYYITDDLTDRALAYLSADRRDGAGRPWYLYLAYNAPHSPLHVRAADRDHYRGRFDHGWDAAREARLARQKAIGIVPPSTELPPRNPGVSAWAELSERQRRISARYMEVYAGVVHRLDWNIGRVIDALARSGELEDTLIIFASDNGGSAEGMSSGTPNLLAGITQEISEETVEGLLDRMGEEGTFPHYPTGWAMVSNTPFKMYKQMTELGGVADPMIVKWPRGTGPAAAIRREFVHVADIHPTILEIANVAPDGKGRPIEGVSFAPSRSALGIKPRSQYFEIRGRRAMYHDSWRLVGNHQPGTPFEADEWRLYDLSTDFNETRDLADRHPGLVARLKAEWDDAARRFNVLPLDNRSPIEKARNGPWLVPRQSHWELRPGLDRISADFAPAVSGRDHRISIAINRMNAADEGVLLAYGSMYFGWVIYVQGGRLVYEIANIPFGVRVVSDAMVPIGRSVVRYEQTMRARPFLGVGRLFIDDVVVAELELPPFAFGVPYQGLELGRNGACAVSRAYAAPFAFQGQIESASIDYDVTPYTPEEMAAIVGRTRLRL